MVVVIGLSRLGSLSFPLHFFCWDCPWLQQPLCCWKEGSATSSKQSLCRTGTHGFSGCVSHCQECQVKISFGLFGFSQETLSLFDGCFSLPVGLLMSRASWPVFETPLVRKNGKLLTCKLWAIVADYNFGNTLSGKMTLEFPYHSAGFRVY